MPISSSTKPRIPAPVIKRRRVDREREQQGLQAGLSPTVARVLASRPWPAAGLDGLLRPGLSALDHFEDLPDIERAAARIASAIANGEVIGLETDHDTDGVTAHSVLWSALVDYFGHPRDRIRSYIGHRLQEGYGLSEPVAARILADSPRPTLVITADNGSSDEPRIMRLAAAGVDVIVTDHHELPEDGPPASALACVSPARIDSKYPDASIAGCMVSWLLACAVRQQLINSGHLAADSPRLAGLLDYVALGTVADCVDLAGSVNNRAVVREGLRRIEAGTRACWRAVRPRLGDAAKSLSATDLAFGIGPRINARGRLDEAMAGVKFLLSESDTDAESWEALLHEENERRKDIERTLLRTALQAGASQVESGRKTLAVWLPDGHAGVHGIVASRLVEAFGRPVICLSPGTDRENLVSGSARGVPGFHVRDSLQQVYDSHPGLLLRFGGHRGAAGLTLERAYLDSFSAAWERASAGQLDGVHLGPVVWTDGELESGDITMELVESLQALDPFGQQFEAPCFEGAFPVEDVRTIGDGSHLRLRLRAGQAVLSGVWFRALEPGETLPLAPGDEARFVFTPELNVYRGNASLQVRILHAFDVVGR